MKTNIAHDGRGKRSLYRKSGVAGVHWESGKIWSDSSCQDWHLVSSTVLYAGTYAQALNLNGGRRWSWLVTGNGGSKWKVGGVDATGRPMLSLREAMAAAEAAFVALKLA